MNLDLRDAIAGLYGAFQAPRPTSMVACPCCNTPERVGRLIASSRETISGDEIAFYAHKAVTTVGGPDELRYFWPRLAELAVMGELPVDPEIVFGKLRIAGHVNWPPNEVDALRGLGLAIGRWLAQETLDPEQVDSWVCCLGILSEDLWDITEFLGPLAGDDAAARDNLRRFLEWNVMTIARKSRLSNSFWSAAPEGEGGVVQWLLTNPAVFRAYSETGTA